MREGLAANKIEQVYGILNGTCNYILTQMRETGREFSDVLAEAQKLGYAEADPSFDVDGVDAAHKLSILTSVAFGCQIDFSGRPDQRHPQRLGDGYRLCGRARLSHQAAGDRAPHQDMAWSSVCMPAWCRFRRP